MNHQIQHEVFAESDNPSDTWVRVDHEYPLATDELLGLNQATKVHFPNQGQEGLDRRNLAAGLRICVFELDFVVHISPFKNQHRTAL